VRTLSWSVAVDKVVNGSAILFGGKVTITQTLRHTLVDTGSHLPNFGK